MYIIFFGKIPLEFEFDHPSVILDDEFHFNILSTESIKNTELKFLEKLLGLLM